MTALTSSRWGVGDGDRAVRTRAALDYVSAIDDCRRVTRYHGGADPPAGHVQGWLSTGICHLSARLCMPAYYVQCGKYRGEPNESMKLNSLPEDDFLDNGRPHERKLYKVQISKLWANFRALT